MFEYFVILKNKSYMFRTTSQEEAIDSNNTEYLLLFDVLNTFDGSFYSCKLCKQVSSNLFGTVHFYKYHNIDEYYTVVKETLETKNISKTGKIDPLDRLDQLLKKN